MRVPATIRDTELHRRLDEAWEVHRAMILSEIRDPALRANPQWMLLRMDAYEAYYNLMMRWCDGR